MRNKRGITLIALVITIIILLILAGITISQLTGSGLFENAKLAEQKSKNAQEKEESILDEYEGKIGQYVDGFRNLNNGYVEIDDYAKKIIENTKQKYKLTVSDLFNNSEYVDKIIESQENIDYILNNKNILDIAIDSNYMMTKLLSSNKKDEVIAKLDESCTTIPNLTSINGEDSGKCFGTAPYPDFGYQLWHAFATDEEYAYKRNRKFQFRI